jgi:hypothetical protein
VLGISVLGVSVVVVVSVVVDHLFVFGFTALPFQTLLTLLPLDGVVSVFVDGVFVDT